MSVELKVTLVGDDPQQQEAFNDPQRFQPGAAPSLPDMSTSTPTAIPGDPLVLSMDQLTRAIDALTQIIASIIPQQPGDAPPVLLPPDGRQNQAEPQEQSENALRSMVERFDGFIQQRISQFGLQDTRVGRAVSEISQSATEQLARAIDALTQAIGGQNSQQPAQPGPQLPSQPANNNQPAPNNNQPSNALQGMFEKLDGFIQQRIAQFGLSGTRIGRLIGGASQGAATLAGRAGAVGQTVAGFFGAGGTSGAAGAGGAAAASSAAAGGASGAVALAAVAGPAVAVAAGLAAAVLSVKAFSDMVSRAADELEDLSPDIALVRAQFDATRQLQRLDRAQAIGPQFAQMEAARFRINEAMYDVQSGIYQLMAKGAPALEFILDGVTAMVRQVEVQVAIFNQLAAFITTPFDKTDDVEAAKATLAAMNKAAEAMTQIFQNDAGDFGKMDPFLGELLNLGNAQPAQPQVPLPPQPPFP